MRTILTAILTTVIVSNHVFAHSWYDPACCSDRDCAPVHHSRITLTDAGVRVQLDPGDHPFVYSSLDVVIPYDDPRVRNSQDVDHHACVAPALADPSAETVTEPRVLCVYIAAVF